MNAESSKWVEVASKLIKLTQEGRLKWKKAIGDYSLDNIENTDLAFVTQYKNKTLRIYRFRYKVEAPTAGLSSISNFSTAISIYGERKYPYWASAVVLEFIDDQGNSLWKFPDTKALDDLYSSIQYTVAGVSDFLEDILNDE